MLLNVQFSDETETVIISHFGAQQDPELWPNQGELSSEDPRWKAYFDAQAPFTKEMLPKPE